MAISEAKVKIVIDNYFPKECDINTSIRAAFEKGFRLGLQKAIPAADVRPVEESAQLLAFAHFVAKMVCVSDERWEDEYSGYRDIFPELACRKLHKLGIVGKSEDGNWVYPGMPL